MDSENKNNENTDLDKQSQPKASNLFTKEEVTSTVKAFVLAWIRGSITIKFPEAKEIQMVGQKQTLIPARLADISEATKAELEGKKVFMKLVQTISGEQQATVAEQEKAMSDLFEWLLAYRCGQRIVGTFGNQDDYERRLTALEEQITAMNVVIEELILAVRSMPKR